MGWTYSPSWTTKEKLVAELLNEPRTVWAPIAHSVVGNNLWVVFERKPEAPTSFEWPGSEPYVYPDRVIALYLMQSGGRDGWGYKDIDESMCPSEINCPLRFLDMVKDPGDYATAWRERVRGAVVEKREKAGIIQGLRVGQVVELVEGCKPARVTVASVKPLTGYDDAGKCYRVQARHVAAVVGGGRLAL